MRPCRATLTGQPQHQKHIKRRCSCNQKSKKAGVHPDLSTLRLQPERHALYIYKMVVPDHIEPISSGKWIIAADEYGLEPRVGFRASEL